MLARIGSFMVACGLFPLLCLHCISTDSLSISKMLQGLVNTGLTGANMAGAQVKADGRDIILTGTVPSEEIKVKAGALAMAMPGVRTVDNQLNILETKAIQADLDKILLNAKIEFESGKAVILPQSTPVLESVLAVVQKAPQLTLAINGHTDNLGDAAANRALSQARAQAVVDWLAQHGISASRAKATGFGPDKPIASNATPAGRAQNRRVELIANQ